MEMSEFEEIKVELMKESLEDLLEQVFSGSYTSGPTEAAIREKVVELKQNTQSVDSEYEKPECDHYIGKKT